MADQRQDSQLLLQPPEPLSHEKSRPPGVGISDYTSLNSLESVESSLVQPSSITKAPSMQSFMSSDTSSPRRSEYFLKSDAFSAATKLEVKRLAGENCWACGRGLAGGKCYFCSLSYRNEANILLCARHNYGMNSV